MSHSLSPLKGEYCLHSTQVTRQPSYKLVAALNWWADNSLKKHIVVDEAAIIWLKVLKQNDWGKNGEVDWILTHTNAQLRLECKITDVTYNYHCGFLQVIRPFFFNRQWRFGTWWSTWWGSGLLWLGKEKKKKIWLIYYASGNPL